MTGTPSYQGFASLPTAGTGWQIAGLGDFDRNGSADILVNNSAQGWNGLWRMSGSSYQGWTDLPIVSGWKPLGTGDFNGDGKTDIVVNNAANGWNGVWLMNGTTYKVHPISMAMGSLILR